MKHSKKKEGYFPFLQVIGEGVEKSRTEKKLKESADLMLMLQSGILLCKLAFKVVPDTEIDLEKLQVNLN